MRAAEAPRGIDHQEELEEVLLRRCGDRLDDEDISLAAIRQQLDLEAVVGEASQAGRQQRNVEVPADLLCQVPVGLTAEDRDLVHAPPRSVAAAD
jgi:hypothetical protein